MERKHRDIYLGVLIICITFIVITGFLLSKEVVKRHTLYYFTRIYKTETVKTSQITPRKEASVVTSKTKSANIIDSVYLDSKRMLSFEAITADKGSSFAFFVSSVDGLNRKRRCVYKLPFADKYENMYERSMAYYGTFLRAYKNITFTFAHLPYIVVFTGEGCPLTIIKTKDGVPNPVIIQYKDYYLYKRGETFSSNISAYVKKDNVYVFSYRIPTDSKQFIVDVYDLGTKKYKYSLNVYNENSENNIDIKRFYADSLSVCLETKKGYYQLIN